MWESSSSSAFKLEVKRVLELESPLLNPDPEPKLLFPLLKPDPEVNPLPVEVLEAPRGNLRAVTEPEPNPELEDPVKVLLLNPEDPNPLPPLANPELLVPNPLPLPVLCPTVLK